MYTNGEYIVTHYISADRINYYYASKRYFGKTEEPWFSLGGNGLPQSQVAEKPQFGLDEFRLYDTNLSDSEIK